MKKKDYKILSTKKCKVCGKFLKQNLIDKNPEAENCYKCYPFSKRNRAKYQEESL